MSQSDSDKENIDKNIDPLNSDSLPDDSPDQPRDNSDGTTPFPGVPEEDMNSLLAGLDAPQLAENTQQGLEAFAARVSGSPESSDESTASRILSMDTDSIGEPEDTLSGLGRLEQNAEEEEAAEVTDLSDDGSAAAGAVDETDLGGAGTAEAGTTDYAGTGFEEFPSGDGADPFATPSGSFEQQDPFETGLPGGAGVGGTGESEFGQPSGTGVDGKTQKKPDLRKSPKKTPAKKKKRERKPQAPSIFVSPITWICLLIWIGGNVWGAMTKNIDKPFFWICFNVLGVVLFSIPVLLGNLRKREGGVNLYNVALALALGLIVVGCMLLVIAQAPYGFKIKP